MTTIVMPTAHPVSASFSIAGYRDVDRTADQSAYFGYLDSVARVFREVIVSGVDRLRLRSGDSVIDVGCGHGASAALLAQRHHSC
jgi:trans-aconitate methyltransferase